MEVLAGLILVGGVLWVIGWAIYKLATMPDRGRLDAMDAAVRDLSHRIAMLERRTDTQDPGDGASVKSLAAPPLEPSGAPPPLPPAEAAPPTQQAPPLPSTVSPVAVSATPPRPDVSLETFLGGRVMLVVGVIVGLFGLAFFLKFAIDHGWIGPGARIAMGVAAGAALLVGGDRMRPRGYVIFGQALMGCGLGALYLSNYFACSIYDMISPLAAFTLTAGITTAGAALALRKSARVLAYLGFLGGYLAPWLLSKSSGDLVGLTVWLCVLDAGLVFVLLRRAWHGLDLMALLVTAVYVAVWFDRYAEGRVLVVACGCLCALLAASLAIGLVPPITRRERPSGQALVGVAIAGALSVVAGHELLFPAHRWALGAGVVILGAAYGLASALATKRIDGARPESESLLGFAGAALATAVAVVASGSAVSPALSATGLAVVFAGTRTRHGSLLACGVGTIALACGDLLIHRLGMFDTATTPFLNERFAIFACPCVALLVCGWLMSRTKDVPPEMPTLVAATGLWALPLVVCADMMCGARSMGDVRFEMRLAATTVVLAIYGAVAARLFATGRDAMGRFLAFGPMTMAMIFGLWLFSAGHLTPFTPGWNLTFAAGLTLVTACLYAASTAVEGARERLRAIPLVYLLALVTAEIHVWGQRRPLAGFSRKEAEFVAVVWISIAWAVYAAVLLCVGFWKRRAALRWMGLAVFALTVGKVFFVDMAGLEPVYRIGSFLVLGALLVAASFLYQRARRSDGTPA